jgi:hypothetical protein
LRWENNLWILICNELMGGKKARQARQLHWSPGQYIPKSEFGYEVFFLVLRQNRNGECAGLAALR